MILQDVPDQSAELAAVLQQGLNTNKFGTLVSIMEGKTSKKKLEKLKSAIDNKQIVSLQLHEKYGKVKIPRYEIVIDFDKNEVHVRKINLEHVYLCNTFEVV